MRSIYCSIVLFLASAFCTNVCMALEYHKWDSLNQEQKELLTQAANARDHAYAPYSNYQVGAALKTVEGQIVTGANVENASYGLTICAERTAVFKAVSEGRTSIKMMALVTKDGAMPCGACREVIQEFNPNTILLISDIQRKKIIITTLKEILPHQGRYLS